MKPMLLGVTGGIGSGKSSVSHLLAAYCLAPRIDMDHSCRRLLEVEQPGWCALRDALDSGFFLPGGELDRPALRERLFADNAFKQKIDALLHPLAREAMRREVALLRASLILIEIPLLFEAGWQMDVDAVLVVHARRAIRCCRIMNRDGVTRRSAARAIASQLDEAVKVRQADFVIDNSGSWIEVREDVIALGRVLSRRVPEEFGKKVLDSRT
ncbi:dephospho-CoA kinase [Desulfobulbus alkaliphilus]|uniref:dephospho-CoA kinase n=1 Tax=Desulfobulbus alkaliphilus TaxID=869814 RepID=UPI0019645A4A|nr:dephospho-CoA kinase [Desulfobulbus alkaliphilus]MBM9536376.1 dephospho-CoA kinase [Desulfobulbus alkaliphilus]